MKFRQYYFILISVFISVLLYCKQTSYAVSFLSKNQHEVQTSYVRQKKETKAVHQQNKKKQSPHLKAGADQSAVWSDAFTFQKMWGSQVDPRTGIFSTWIKTGNLISNMNRGPNIALNINYSSSALANPDGLGRGWSWNLTHFNPANNQLTTSQGQSFWLYQTDKNHWWPRYHKLKDILISGNKQKNFVITYANGLKETLNHDGYETCLEQQDGRSVHFSYLPGTHLLSRINDDTGRKISLSYRSNYIHITSYSSDGTPVTIHIDYANGQLHAISIPVANASDYKNINLSYVGSRISGITYPTGLRKTVEYNCNNAMKLPLTNDQTNALCVVTKATISPGFGQPDMTVSYSYDKTSPNEHNYLAHNSGLNLLQNSGQDTLFKTPASYTYQTTADNGIIKQISTFNKYHLLIDTKTISDADSHVLTETHNFFCRTDVPDGCAQTSFKELPVTYDLPLKTETKTWSDTSPGQPPSQSPAIFYVTKQYDKKGRLIISRDSYGREKKITYCPVNGSVKLADCPEQLAGWSLVSLIHSITESAPGSDLPPVSKYMRYRKLPNINGNGYMIKEIGEDTISGSHNNYIVTTRQYYDDPHDPFTYGLLKKTLFYQNLTNNKNYNSIVRYYYYRTNAAHSVKTSYSEVVLDPDKNKRSRSPVVRSSLFTNQVLSETDAEGKNTNHYVYDFLGRVIQIDLATGTQFATSKHYTYTTSPTLNQVLITAGNGLKRKIIFDGAGRKLKGFDETLSDTGKANNTWRMTYNTDYDAYGHVAAKYNYIPYNINQDEGSGAVYKIIPLVTKFDYDNRGRVVTVHLPDGEKTVKQYDDSNRCIISYRQDASGHYSPVSVIHNNILDKPVQQILLPAMQSAPTIALCALQADKIPGAQVSVITWDHYGRAVSATDPTGKTVTKRYDSLGHVTDIINSAGDRIHSVFNVSNQVVATWVYPASSHKGYLLYSCEYDSAGRLLWKTGEDGKKTYFTYTPDGQIATKTTPIGHTVSWQYNLPGLPVQESLDGKIISQTDYDHLTLFPVKKQDITGTTTYAYADDGKLQQVSRFGTNGYPDYHLQWHYNPARQVISALDISGNKVVTRYDQLGRVAEAVYEMQDGDEELLYKMVYDGFSRADKIYYGSHTQSTKNSVRTIQYDTLGRQSDVTDFTESTDNLSKQVFFEEKYAYDADNNIIQIIQNGKADQNATLQYQYDKRNNLVSMSCTGSHGLPLCPRDTAFAGSGAKETPVITSQHYTFNILNRITQVTEQLSDVKQHRTLNKVMTYSYWNTKTPLRLQQISTVWNHQSPITKNFSYDDLGNMVIDGEGNHMTYNPFNQITSVLMPDGKEAKYVYDGSGRKTKEIFSSGDISYLLYMNKKLLGEQTGHTGAMHMTSQLGIAKAIDGVIHEFYGKNYKGDIITVMRKVSMEKNCSANHFYQLEQYNVYSPYGMKWHGKSTALSPLYQTLEGFNGERTDPATGWQFLGAGHRTYSPAQRYFLSEDPVGGGYAFGGNNPIMNTDPDGNMPRWLGKLFSFFNTLSYLGMSSSKASVVGRALIWTTILFAITGGIIGLEVAMGAGSPALAMDELLTTGVFSGLMTASMLEPQNKGLNLATNIFGLAILVDASFTALEGVAVGAFKAVSSMVSTPEKDIGQWSELINFAEKVTKSGTLETELAAAIPSDLMHQAGFFSEEGFRIPSNEALIRLWGRLSASEKIRPAMDDQMQTLLIGAKNSLKDVRLDSFKQVISLKLRMLAGEDTEGAFNVAYQSILSSYGSSVSETGFNLTDIMYVSGAKAIITGGKNNEFTGFIKLVSTELGGQNNYIWGIYITEANGGLKYTTGTFKELGLDEFFDENGQFTVHAYCNLGESWFDYD